MSLSMKKKAKSRKKSPTTPPITFPLEIQKQLDEAWNKAANSKGSMQTKKAIKLMQDFLLVDVKKFEFRQQEMLDQETFNAVAGRKLEQKSKALKAFKLFDAHDKGLVVLEDLQRVAADLDETIAVEELEEMIREVDQTGDGFLTTQDFVDIAKEVQL